MQATETAGAEAPAESAPPSAFEDTVLKLLGEMSQRLSRQEERLVAVEQQEPAPRFIDPRVHANTQAADRSRRALAATPDGIPHSDTIPIFPNGQQVPDMLMELYQPKFGSGDLILLNLEEVPHGRDDGKTWGELMAEKGTPNGYGEVFDRTYLSGKVGQGWKYRIKFDKTVMPGSNGGLVALYERELLRA